MRTHIPQTLFFPRSLFFVSLFLILLITFGTQIAQAAGVIDLFPYFSQGSEVQNAIGFRYKIRVNQNQSAPTKIIFGGRRFYGPNSTDTYLLDTNLYDHWIQYTDTGCTSWPTPGKLFSGQAGLWVSVPDYNKKGLVGIRPADAQTLQMFPRANSGIDNIQGLTKIETISQQNITGKDISIQLVRGDTFTTPLDGWGSRFITDASGAVQCSALLPSGVLYRKWLVTAILDGSSYKWEVAFPDDSARYLSPGEMQTFITEFFEHPGFFQAYIWDLEFLREGYSTWERVAQWKMTRCEGGCNGSAETAGAKLSTYAGHPVIEISNDGTASYFKIGDIFTLPLVTATPTPTPSISSTPTPSYTPTPSFTIIPTPPTNLTGKLVRSVESPRIYYVTQGGLKRWMPNAVVFLSYGNHWSDVITVSQSQIDALPDNVLIKLPTSAKIYKLENGKKRWIQTASIFTRNGFNWNQIAPVNLTELNAYPLGAGIR